jgi:hypothetical protein
MELTATPVTGFELPEVPASPVQVVHRVEIDAPFDTVWALAGDISRYPEWVEATDIMIDGDLVAEQGATYVEKSRVLGPITARSSWAVLTADADRGLHIHRSDDVGGMSPVLVVMHVEPLRSGTAFTLALSASPPPGLRRILRRVLAQSNQRSVAQFAELARGVAG